MKASHMLGVRLAVVVGVLVLPVVTASALTVTVDGKIDEWVQNAAAIYTAADPGAAAFTPVAGVVSWIEDGPNSGGSGYVGPGYGGQNYDIEAMYAYADDTGVYVAIVTGFDPDGEWGWGGGTPHIRPGDVFFDFAPLGNGTWDMAVETSGGVYGPQAEAYGGTPGNGYTQNGVPWYTNPTDYVDSTPSEIIHVGDVATDQGATAAGPHFAYSDMTDVLGVNDDDAVGASGNPSLWYADDHNVIEIYLSNTYLASLGFGLDENGVDVQVHWTEQCGNDVGITPTLHVPQVPEPMSMVMLGCLGSGMLGVRAAAKRRKKRA